MLLLLECKNTLAKIFVMVITIVLEHAPAENCQRYQLKTGLNHVTGMNHTLRLFKSFYPRKPQNPLQDPLLPYHGRYNIWFVTAMLSHAHQISTTSLILRREHEETFENEFLSNIF
jgi:hypothetical protein